MVTRVWDAQHARDGLHNGTVFDSPLDDESLRLPGLDPRIDRPGVVCTCVVEQALPRNALGRCKLTTDNGLDSKSISQFFYFAYVRI